MQKLNKVLAMTFETFPTGYLVEFIIFAHFITTLFPQGIKGTFKLIYLRLLKDRRGLSFRDAMYGVRMLGRC